jgi:hypothetical protein
MNRPSDAVPVPLDDVFRCYLLAAALRRFWQRLPEATWAECEKESEIVATNLGQRSLVALKDEVRRIALFRANRYVACSWSRQEIPIEECRIFPPTDNRRWPSGMVPEAAARIEEMLARETTTPEEREWCARLPAQRAVIAKILAIVPVIVVRNPPGIFNDFYGGAKGRFDLDDGAHRALAACAEGHATLPAFVGTWK